MIKKFINVEYGEVKASFIDGKAYLCLVDVCKMFEIENINEIRSSFNKYDEKLVDVSATKVKKNMIFISEDALSICVAKSHKAEAEMILDWLYRIVIPEILFYNDYNLDNLKDPNVAKKFIEEVEDLRIENNVLRTTIKINAPKLTSINKLLGTNKCVDIDSVIHIIRYHNLQLKELFRILRACNIFSPNNEPYQEYCDRKLFRIVESKAVALGETIISKRIFVYSSGIKFIEKILKGYEGDKFGKTDG